MKTIISGTMLSLVIVLLAISPVAAQEVVNEIEPNHTMGLGQPIDTHCNVLGNIGAAGDSLDWYRVNTYLPNELVQIILSFNNADCNIDLEVWANETTMIGATSGVDSQKELKFTPSDMFYIRILPTSGQGDYSFTIDQAGGWDDFGDNIIPGVGGCG